MTDAATILEGRPASMGELVNWRVSQSPDREAFRYPDASGSWVSLTWRQTADQVNQVAAGLLSLGLAHEERVAIASATRIEWIIADYAVNAAAGATTAIYPNTETDDFRYIVEHSGSGILFADSADQVAKVGDDSTIRTIVLFDGEGDGERVLSWQQLKERGAAHLAEHPNAVTDATAATGRQTLATLIYTSGTTGRPKGVELTHENLIYEGAAVDQLEIIVAEDLQFLWLPLSHVFGKVLLVCQLVIGFVSAVDGRLDQIVPGLGATEPTFMCGAPRIYEKVRNAVLTNATGIKARISRWAFRVGKQSHPYRLEGKPMPALLGLQYQLADRLVYSKLRDRLGGRISFMVSGSAKLNSQVQGWFYSAGLLIIEGYGLTETTAVSFVNVPKTPRLGTVGPVVPGTECRIAEDGEVLLKGPGVMRGYHKAPELTAEVLVDGWFHTGDIGHLDADGYLTLTDRKKDLMKTSGGKYVAPQRVEGALIAALPYASQVVAVGDGRKYISALLTMDRDNLMKWAARKGMTGKSYEEVCASPELHASVERRIARANHGLERWETVKKFTILDHEFTLEEGGVTPNMKLRRANIAKHYADAVDAMYDAEGLDSK